MKRRAALVAVLALVAAGLAAVVLTRANASALPARDLRGVLAQVRESFGDDHLVRAAVDGSTLHLVVTRKGADGDVRSDFEAEVLAAAVADYTRSHGQTPIEHFEVHGKDHLGSKRLFDVARTPAGPSLRLDTCKAAARASIRDAWSNAALASVKWLPYLHGMCFVRLRNVPGYPAAAVPQAGLAVAQHLILRLRTPELTSSRLFLEVDDPHGRQMVEFGRLPRKWLWWWVRRDLPLPYGWSHWRRISLWGSPTNHEPAHLSS